MNRHCHLIASIAALLIFTAPSLAADVDPTSVVQSLNTATGPDAARLLDNFPLDQVPALLTALTSNHFNPGSRDDVMDPLAKLVRRARVARTDAELASEEPWAQITGVETYKKSAYRGSAWDALAIAAFTNDTTAAPFHAAISAGCTDPLIRYYAIRRDLASEAITSRHALAHYIALIPDMDNSSYSPARKFQLHIQILRTATSLLTADPTAHAAALDSFQKAVALLPSLAPEKPSILVLREGIQMLLYSAKELHLPLGPTFHDIEPNMDKLLPGDAAMNAERAQFYTDWAWEARGSGYAQTVSDDGWKLFGERLATAEATAAAGANHDPLNGECPALMITICMGLSHDRPTMESWFTRALLANPDNDDACSRKLGYLRPRWGGSSEAQLEFGRQCLKTGSVASRIPTILIDAHVEVGEDTGNTDDYLAQPTVWADIESVYKKLLSDPTGESPANLRFDRAKYIQYASRCQQWAKVIQLMDQYKDDLDISVFGSPAVYHFQRKQAQQNLTRTPA